jgi:hypothetical protein
VSAKHTPATVRIQRRLERLELEHLREHAAELAERVEQLERDIFYAEADADMWHDACLRFEGTLDGEGKTLGLGLTITGDVVPVHAGALQ